MKVRSVKVELQKLQKVESEYASYRSEVESKLTRFTQLDEDVFRLKAEIEELKMRNERMQKRLAAKENEIKELGSKIIESNNNPFAIEK